MPQLIRSPEDNDMSFTEHRSETVCFTGHRTEKFLDKPIGNETVTINTIRSVLTMMIADAYDRGARYFITGMARGVDLWAGEELLYMKRFLPDVHIIAAVPHPAHEKSIHGSEADIMYAIGNAADAVVCVSEQYTNWCFLRRNDYMLKHSSAVLGVVHTNDSGTAYTLEKAAKYGTKKRIADVRDYRRMIPLMERYPEVYRMTRPSQRYAFWEYRPRLLYQCGLFSQE